MPVQDAFRNHAYALHAMAHEHELAPARIFPNDNNFVFDAQEIFRSSTPQTNPY